MNLPHIRFIQVPTCDAADPRAELASGLLRQPAAVAPKFFYDRLGSALFAAITELPEYYPTRTEAAIFAAHQADMAAALTSRLGPHCTLVDLGAGDGAKAARLFAPLQPVRYVAVDISVDFMHDALRGLQQRFPAIEMVGVGLDFSLQLELPAGVLDGPVLLFYPGSSIGNFGPEAALRLLRQARAAAQGGALLIGVDLVKPRAVLEAAYDDALGVTAAFNLNLLRHVNRVLRSDFDVRDWRHVAFFDAEASRIEMHLEARRAHTVRWPGGERRFESGERIHTEDSYKWTGTGFEALLGDAGYTRVQTWTDERGWFAVMLAFVA
ncbi:MAG: L-histidine N(alpha)-methyltransferase [Rubrivivax sp.]|nr:L-histidine N(alpha)-methyltransferase [Rubrivivax sp.]